MFSKKNINEIGDSDNKRLDRRTFLKTLSAGALALGASAMPILPGAVRKAKAGQPGDFNGCKLVVFGSDSLRFDYAQTLVDKGAPALSYLNAINPIICSLNDGKSCTLTGWTTIWTGMPSFWTRAFANDEFDRMPKKMHIMWKLMEEYYVAENQNPFFVWITGKGHNIIGNRKKGPHRGVYRGIVQQGIPGVYYGDEGRDDADVFALAENILGSLDQYENFCCFVQFRNPDDTGHQTKDYDAYTQKAWEVDEYIWSLMQLLPQDTDIIYCSDHGFDFKSRGDTNNGHRFSPRAMLATNFVTEAYPVVDMSSVGRLIYSLAGGNPDNTNYKEWVTRKRVVYTMHGIDLVRSM
jgi:hypothetical protein